MIGAALERGACGDRGARDRGRGHRRHHQPRDGRRARGIAEICDRDDLWLHVDGAYGGAALADPAARPLFAGIERADSFVVDPHKWLFASLDCAAIVYRDSAIARAANTQHAEYLDAVGQGAEPNASDLAIHMTRRARGLPLWFSLAVNGTAAYERAVAHGLQLARDAAALIERAPELELLTEPELSIVVFRRRGWELEDYQRWSERAARPRPDADRADELARRVPAPLLLRQPPDDDRRRPRGARDPRLTSPTRPARREVVAASARWRCSAVGRPSARLAAYALADSARNPRRSSTSGVRGRGWRQRLDRAAAGGTLGQGTCGGTGRDGGQRQPVHRYERDSRSHECLRGGEIVELVGHRRCEARLRAELLDERAKATGRRVTPREDQRLRSEIVDADGFTARQSVAIRQDHAEVVDEQPSPRQARSSLGSPLRACGGRRRGRPRPCGAARSPRPFRAGRLERRARSGRAAGRAPRRARTTRGRWGRRPDGGEASHLGPPRSLPRRRRAPPRTRSTCRRSVAPARVARRGRCERSTSAVPASRSSAASCCETADWV